MTDETPRAPGSEDRTQSLGSALPRREEADSTRAERAGDAPATGRPGLDETAARSTSSPDSYRRSEPPRSTPLPRRGRSERAERASRERAVARNRAIAVGAGALVIILLAAGAVWAFGRGSSASADGSSLGSQVTSSTRARSNGIIVSTPVFATIKGEPVFLPVPVTSLTAVMYHQASGTHSWPMTSLRPYADRAAIYKEVKAGAKLPIASSAEGTKTVDRRDGETILDSYWKGTPVRVYRTNRVGPPDTAADCGALAGTPVIAPMSGTVTRIRPYKLYGRYPDWEIHIKPDGLQNVDLVVIHVQDLLVRPGDWVVGGVTPIAHVRLLSKYMKHQLADYTGQQGDHTHIQFNKPHKGADAPYSS